LTGFPVRRSRHVESRVGKNPRPIATSPSLS
jgi:hypothetical protein